MACRTGDGIESKIALDTAKMNNLNLLGSLTTMATIDMSDETDRWVLLQRLVVEGASMLCSITRW